MINLCDEFNVPLFINTHSALPRDLNIYSSSKHKFNDILKKRKGPTKILNFVFDYMYGPNDDENKFVLFLIKKVLFFFETVKKLKGGPLVQKNSKRLTAPEISKGDP